MKKILLSVSVLALVVVFAGCKKSSPGPSNNASVMFVHGCAAGATAINLDAIANNTTVTANMAFLNNSGYQNVTAGAGVHLVFKVTGLSGLDSGTETLTANTHYTAFAGGSVLSPTFVFTTDDYTAPTTGNAKIRFINLSNDNMTVTANVQSTVIASGITSQQCSAFTQIAAGSYSIKAGDPSNISTVVSLGNAVQQLSAGKIYTLMLTGTLAGTGSSALTLTLINN